MTILNEPFGVAARRHEIPTHLDVEDRLLFGLPARRALALLSGAAIAFSLWNQAPVLPEAPRAALAAACVLVAAVLTFVRPGERGLEAWGLLAVRFAAQPRVCVWHPIAREDVPGPSALAEAVPTAWEALAPRLAWEIADSHAPRPQWLGAREARPWAS
jgi:hypothetical protein